MLLSGSASFALSFLFSCTLVLLPCTFAQDAALSIREQLGDRLENFRNPCFSYLPANSNTSTLVCVPSIWIAGFGKSGTSALYYYLSLHPQIAGHEQKEVCPLSGESALEFLLRLTQMRAPRSYQLLALGCIESSSPILMQLAKEFHEMRVILLFRMYPSWLYAAWHFWCFIGYDSDCTYGGQWTNSAVHYRSPQIFHELVVAGDRLKHNPLLLNLFSASYYLVFLKENYLFYGRERVLALTSESLAMKSEATLKRVCKWLGLVVPLKFPAAVWNVTVNSNCEKGVTSFVNRSAVLGGCYPAMFPETFAILQQRWVSECTWMVKNAKFDWSCWNQTKVLPQQSRRGYSHIQLSVLGILFVLILVIRAFCIKK